MGKSSCINSHLRFLNLDNLESYELFQSKSGTSGRFLKVIDVRILTFNPIRWAF